MNPQLRPLDSDANLDIFGPILSATVQPAPVDYE